MKSCFHLWFAAVVLFFAAQDVRAFAPRAAKSPSTRPTATLLHLSNQFDVSKPSFDLLTLRNIRGDALLRYNTLNQSEPLRINLYGLLALTLFSAPFISEAVGVEALGVPQIAGAVLAGVGSAGLFVRECGKRSQQLMRIEKELNAQYLQLRLPTNFLADQPFGPPQSFGSLTKSSSPPRIIALCGTAQQLRDSLASLQVVGRRLEQACTYVVPIATDGSSRADWGIDKKEAWLAEAYDSQQWLTYFDELSSETSSVFRWFGLNSNGRSFGSGSREAPQWIQLLGSFLRPLDILDEGDKNVITSDNVDILNAQEEFYSALTKGKLDEMNQIFSSDQSGQVTEVVNAGGRIDEWSSCLEEGARPEGMVVSGADAMAVSDTEACSTCIEFPAVAGIDTATLLAIQQWVRPSATDEWKLKLHETIPWNTESRAQGTLRCDCRGCVALTRGAERRTFGGLIG